MTYENSGKGKIVRAIIILLILVGVAILADKYYNGAVDERDKIEAKAIQRAVAAVLAKSVGSDLTYDSGRIRWTRENALFIKRSIIENLEIDDMTIPLPREDGYYYYMYLDSPYTVVKLPYKIKGYPQVKLDVETYEYMVKSYSGTEYEQVKGVPKVLDSFELGVELSLKKGVAVCLNL